MTVLHSYLSGSRIFFLREIGKSVTMPLALTLESLKSQKSRDLPASKTRLGNGHGVNVTFRCCGLIFSNIAVSYSHIFLKSLVSQESLDLPVPKTHLENGHSLTLVILKLSTVNVTFSCCRLVFPNITGSYCYISLAHTLRIL